MGVSFTSSVVPPAQHGEEDAAGLRAFADCYCHHATVFGTPPPRRVPPPREPLRERHRRPAPRDIRLEPIRVRPPDRKSGPDKHETTPQSPDRLRRPLARAWLFLRECRRGL